MATDPFEEGDPYVAVDARELMVITNVTYRAGALGCAHGQVGSDTWFFANVHAVPLAALNACETDRERDQLLESAPQTMYLLSHEAHALLSVEMFKSAVVAQVVGPPQTIHEPSKEDL